MEPTQSISVESIPEVLEDKDSVTEQSDSGASVPDIDYVNPRGVRFTQSTQRDGMKDCSKPVINKVIKGFSLFLCELNSKLLQVN